MKFSHQENAEGHSNNYKLRTPRLKVSNAINAVKAPSSHNFDEISPRVIPQMDEAPIPNKLMKSDLPRSLIGRNPLHG